MTPAFDVDATCSPLLTQCPRCKNPHHACDSQLGIHVGRAPAFCATCGKPTPPGSIHTCTPPP